MSKKTIALLLSLCACVSLGTDALAVTIDFTSRNSGPGDPLVFDGVTATAFTSTGAGQAATVKDVGLGVNLTGSPGSVDRIDYYSRNSSGLWTATSVVENVSLQVNGVFNSFTVQPHFTVLQGEQAQLPFEFGYLGVLGNFRQTTFVAAEPPFPPLTLSLQGGMPVDNTDIVIQADFSETPFFIDYLNSTSFLQVTFLYGLSVTSLDYTPIQAIPEPGTLFLVCSGLMGLAGFGRRFVR